MGRGAPLVSAHAIRGATAGRSTPRSSAGARPVDHPRSTTDRAIRPTRPGSLVDRAPDWRSRGCPRQRRHVSVRRPITGHGDRPRNPAPTDGRPEDRTGHSGIVAGCRRHDGGGKDEALRPDHAGAADPHGAPHGTGLRPSRAPESGLPQPRDGIQGPGGGTARVRVRRGNAGHLLQAPGGSRSQSTELALPAPCPVQSAEGLALAHQPLGVLDLPAFGHGQHVTGGWARDRRSSKPPQPTYHPTSQRGSEAIACSWLSLTTTTLAGLLLNAALGFERAAIWRWPGMKGFGPRPATCPGVWHDDREGISS
jgi:hypothetical protein